MRVENDPVPAVLRSPERNVAQWVIVALLGVIAAGLWLRPGGLPEITALAQPSGAAAGARGVFAFTGQLDSSRYGLFMLDVDEGTLWCYELESSGGARKLRLIAARSWIYDRYLQDFNCAPPDFRMVQELVTQQRQSAARRAGDPADERTTPSAADE